MKIGLSTLKFPDVEHLYYIVRYKRHWWSRWHYVMDDLTGCPRLFCDKTEALTTARDEGNKK